MNKLRLFLKKLIDYTDNNVINVELGLMFHNTFNEIYLIPTISVSKNGKYFQITLCILFIQIYASFHIKDFNEE